MADLKNSVGQGGVNSPEDVQLVQHQLNAAFSRLDPAPPVLVEDGLIGQKTIDAILAFQRQSVGLSNPDGRIDPDGPTWQVLQQPSTAAGSTASPLAINPNWPANVQDFVRQILPAVREVKATWGVPVSVCIAQAALESAWGRIVKNNAYFGIKGKSLSGNSTAFTTSEFVNGQKITIQDTFRAYQDFAEAADDYGRFLRSNPRYDACFAVKDDPLRFADELQAAHYATDPDYAEKLKHIIETYGLTDYEV